MRITVVGVGYVGLSLGALLSSKYEVTFFDIDERKINLIKDKISPLKENDIQKLLIENDFKATNIPEEAYQNSDIYIICVPSNFDSELNYFDTGIIDKVIKDIVENTDKGIIAIKSTIPIGYTKKISSELDTDRIIFSPEFLREGNSVQDNLSPSRIIVGGKQSNCAVFGKLLESITLNNPPVLNMGTVEAEAIKLFSNTYLAMRVSFFNELDNFCYDRKLETKDVIDGVTFDERIGSLYKNPSFGYGGYCLPKDTKQLFADFEDIPSDIIGATIQSNDSRINFLANKINSKIHKEKIKVMGLYKFAMKLGSDNSRESAILKLLGKIKKQNLKILCFEPNAEDLNLENIDFCDCIETFKSKSEIIIANRIDSEISDVTTKIFTRDVYGTG